MDHRRTWITAIAGLGLLLLAAGCEKDDNTPATPDDETIQSPTSGEVREDVNQALDTTGRYLNEQRREFMKNAETTMANMKRKMSEWNAELDEKKEELSAKTKDEREALKRHYDEAKERFEAMQDKSGEAWDAAKDDFQRSWENLQKAWDDAKTEMQDQPETAPE